MKLVERVSLFCHNRVRGIGELGCHGRVFCVHIIHILFFSTILTCQSAAQKAQLMWSKDISADPDFSRRLVSSAAQLKPPTLGFLNNNQAVIAFNDGVISEQGPNLQPLGFHVVEVKVNSGQFGHRLSFSVLTDSSQAKVIEGGFLVLAGEELRKYSGAFEEIATLPTPLKRHGQPTQQVFGSKVYWNPRYESWQLDVAPGGATFTLGHVTEPMHLDLRWLRAADFTELQSLKTHTWKDVFATNNGALLVDPMMAVFVSGGRQIQICQECSMVYLITDNLFFLDRVTDYEITNLSGEKLGEGKLSVNTNSFARAMNANRMAFSTGAYSGYGFPLITHFPNVHLDVKVFDWKQMKDVADVRLEKKVGKASTGFSQSAIALSPDGTILIVLDDSKLSCYKMPQ